MQESENYIEHLDLSREITAVGPLCAELFLFGNDQVTSSPLDIYPNPELSRQAAQRRELYSQLSSMFELIPVGTHIDTAMQEGLMESDAAVALYQNMSRLLEIDENNARILLYFPFEFLPDFRNSEDQTDQVKIAAKEFGGQIRDCWIRLLHETESRANFVDGDILEPGLEDPEKVSKAGHITPELLAKGIINSEDIKLLIEVINDKTILTSLAEGITIANERGLVDGTDSVVLEVLIANKVGSLHRVPRKERYYNDPNSEKISLGRVRWLRKVQQEVDDNQRAEEISETIVAGADVDEIVEQHKGDRVVVLGIIKAGMKIWHEQPLNVGEYLRKVVHHLMNLRNSNDPIVQDAVVSGINHWAKTGIINNDFLQRIEVKAVDLSVPSQFDEKEFSEEFGFLLTAAKKISEHPLLSSYLYPTFLLFGSRTKGHANTNSDLDAAIFFKPGIKLEDRKQILATLKRDVLELEHADSFLEFWTTQEDGKLRFTVPVENTRIFVGEDQIHFFMGGVWIGKKDDVNKMRSEILEGYLNLQGTGDERDERRRMLLGLLELDALQYRILHKGYRMLYPSMRKGGTKNSDLVDWDSDFWDPGYRRIATKLFLSKVFLPNLS